MISFARGLSFFLKMCMCVCIHTHIFRKIYIYFFKNQDKEDQNIVFFQMNVWSLQLIHVVKISPCWIGDQVKWMTNSLFYAALSSEGWQYWGSMVPNNAWQAVGKVTTKKGKEEHAEEMLKLVLVSTFKIPELSSRNF